MTDALVTAIRRLTARSMVEDQWGDADTEEVRRLLPDLLTELTRCALLDAHLIAARQESEIFTGRLGTLVLQVETLTRRYREASRALFDLAYPGDDGCMGLVQANEVLARPEVRAITDAMRDANLAGLSEKRPLGGAICGECLCASCAERDATCGVACDECAGTTVDAVRHCTQHR
jgi:hypothetical protein